ncbi:MAG: hypothetical protein KBS94_06915 [Prevotella sp.]|nr:hypothetical protein [Candidatus Equicola faecalis]
MKTKTLFTILFAVIVGAVTKAQEVNLQLNDQSQVQDVFNTLSQSEGKSVTLTVSPGVYWLDDADDQNVRMNPDGEGTPYAVTINCRELRIIGSDANASHTVFAVNRGQTQGAIGNFTMMLFRGERLYTENITYGNYCNVDLVYDLNPSLNRAKRNAAIVQAQLAHCPVAESVTARNCRFISRLNLCNFTGARHAEFYNCHMECTDDALAGNSLYRQCEFIFYGSKPFYSTGKGSTFEDCDIYIKHNNTQYLTKATSPVTLINTRFHSDHKVKLGWCHDNDPSICSATGVTLNGKSAKFDDKKHIFHVEKSEMLNGERVIGNSIITFDAFETKDTRFHGWHVDLTKPAWYYGTAQDGAEGHTGYVQEQKGARMLIRSKKEGRGCRSLQFTAVPCKSAGQGFGSALDQYMDMCIAMDTERLNGYGLRIQRTPQYDHAVAVSLVEYHDGEVRHLTTPQKCELFRTPCIIRIALDGDMLTASLSKGKERQVLSTTVGAPMGGAFMIQHTGSVGASATLIKDIKAKYKVINNYN